MTDNFLATLRQIELAEDPMNCGWGKHLVRRFKDKTYRCVICSEQSDLWRGPEKIKSGEYKVEGRDEILLYSLEKLLFVLMGEGHTRILVTGPQRSGTTIGARILAAELGFEYLDEEMFAIFDDCLFTEFVSSKDKFVAQAPGLSFACHRLPVTVVWMNREQKDIESSEKRIRFNDLTDRKMREQYSREYPGYKNQIETIDHLAKLKLYFWQMFQYRMLFPRSFNLSYETLRDHKFWVPKKNRLDFKPRQWKE